MPDETKVFFLRFWIVKLIQKPTMRVNPILKDGEVEVKAQANPFLWIFGLFKLMKRNKKKKDAKGELKKSDSFLAGIGGDKTEGKKKFKWAEFYLDPSGDLYYYWVCVIAASVMYNLLFIICRLAFDQLVDYKMLFLGVDIFNDFVYSIDIFGKFYTGYLDKGLMITGKKSLALFF